VPQPPRSRKKPLILVVDDTATVRQMARDSLEPLGLEVIEAEDGEAGLQAFLEERPDLVLLDVNMPRRDGCSMCEEIRRTPGGRNTPVLIMTASEEVDSIRRAYEAGATDFTTKPISWMVLSHRVLYMLRMSSAVQELSRSRERLAKAQRIARLGNWEIHLKSGALDGSDELLRLYGVSSERPAVNLDRLLRSVHPDDQVVVRKVIGEALREGTGFHVDHRVILPEGDLRHVHLQGEVVFDDGGEPTKISGTAQDITDRKKAEDHARLFREQLTSALAQAQRHKQIIGLLFVDLDHFKRVNDTFGHSVGDRLLRCVADRLVNSVRTGDFVSRSVPEDAPATVSRFGGDEFMVSLCSIRSPEEAAKVADRILESLAREFEIEGHEITVTASVGITVAPADGEDVDTLFRNADTAMYHAKEQGRGNYQFYERSMNETALQNLAIERELRAALGGGELLLHYQPKIEIATDRIVGFEALLRWQHADRGMVPPDEFISIAERSGLIGPLGEFVLESACAQAKAWREAGLPPVRISVNLSAHQFRTDEIAETVTRLLQNTPLSPRSLDLEITESTMMENKGVAVRVLQQLKGMGITVALDDFGTGYSSLSYLKGFPVDSVKIDISFIRDITRDPDNAAITAAIISMAKTLNVRVVAEGVETQEQLDFLRNHGCDEFQGFLFSPAVPPDEAADLLRESLDDTSSTFPGTKPS
jgi:diguanylate cyclase (GGDEF)-like protein/PAS domain S-box-containing protein